MNNQLIEPTLVTWLLVLTGAITLLPLVLAQLVILIKPDSQLARNLLVGKNEQWRDKTHFRSAYGCAWADWLIMLPLAVVGSIAVVQGYPWGYVLWAAAGAISLYINVVLWFVEREYVLPAFGQLAYYTYYWGFFVLWGAAALGYAVVRLGGFDF
jgi:hypothetical protein